MKKKSECNPPLPILENAVNKFSSEVEENKFTAGDVILELLANQSECLISNHATDDNCAMLEALRLLCAQVLNCNKRALTLDEYLICTSGIFL